MNSNTLHTKHKVLIVTGGLLDAGEAGFLGNIRKLYFQVKSEKSPWLSFKVKLNFLEIVLKNVFEKRKLRKKYSKNLQNIFKKKDNTKLPHLTEVVLGGLLYDEGIDYQVVNFSEIFGESDKVKKSIKECDVVFISSTLLHDLSELMPLTKYLKTEKNKIVVGGALSGTLIKDWRGDRNVDILAIGYGELLIKSLADWIKSGFSNLVPPTNGRIEQKQHTIFLHSGSPKTRDLDFLPTPNWELAESYHNQKFNMIYYESVRGCPYRCSFCNYPYLFDDTIFRVKSAEKIANDWKYYSEKLDIEYITCLDSLFTMPKKRLVDLCNLLIEMKVKIKWICYARASDLADEEVVALMVKAGAYQVHIGIESGDQEILDNMNKKVKVEYNHDALKNCKKHGLTTIATLIVGFPGETQRSLDRTYDSLVASPPDLFFIAVFSTRVADVPILSQENRKKFGINIMDNTYTMSPYWTHNTMSCLEAANLARTFEKRLMANKVSLNAIPFYDGLLEFDSSMREEMLDYQQNLILGHPLLEAGVDLLSNYFSKKLNRDLKNLPQSQ